jgi:hypothetical protein
VIVDDDGKIAMVNRELRNRSAIRRAPSSASRLNACCRIGIESVHGAMAGITSAVNPGSWATVATSPHCMPTAPDFAREIGLSRVRWQRKT